MKNTPNQQNIIGRRLFRQSLVIAFVMTVALTMLQIWLNFRNLQGSLQNTFDQIKQVQLSSISTALWNYSMPELKTQTEGIVNFPYITYAEVRDTAKVLTSSGIKLEKNFQDETIPISYTSNDTTNLIGYLYIQANNNEIDATLLKDVIQLFIFSAINVFILTLIFLIMIDRQVTRHLNAASDYFKNFDIKSKNSSLKLNKTDSNDELDSLVSAFNTMQTNLTLSYEQQTETERKHATLLSNMPGMAYRCKNDRDWTMEVVSAGCLELTGYPEDAIIDNKLQSYNNLILPEDRDYVWESIQAQLKKEQAFEVTYRICAKNGEIKWVWERGTGVFSSDHDLAAIEGFITDITERKQQERELEAIASVSIALRSVETREEVFPVVLEKTTSLLSANGGLIELIDPATGDSVVKIASGSYEKLLGLRLGIKDGLNSYIRETGKPYLNNNVVNDPRRISRISKPDFRAACGVPMIAHGQLIGFLWIARNIDISEKAVNTLVSIADIAANTIYRVSLFHQKEQQVNQLTGLRKIDTAINSNFELPYTLQILLDQTIDLLQVKAACIFSFETKSQMVHHLAGSGFNGHLLETNRMIDRTSIIGRAILERNLIQINNFENENLPPHMVEQFRTEGLKACFVAPLIAKEEVIGALQVFFEQPFFPDADWIQFLETLAGQAAIAISDSNMVRNLRQSNLELEMAYDATLEGWSNALDLRDNETEKHTIRVTEITLEIAKSLGIKGEEIRNIWRGSRLHDIGKMGIPDPILKKPGKLTPEEWVIMKQHPENAKNLLFPITYLRQALDIPYCHHEKWDGSGYPRGLKGEEIPLAARIFAIADVWDAMTQDRVYRKALSTEETLKYITENAGTHFDPKIVEIFLQLMSNRKFD